MSEIKVDSEQCLVEGEKPEDYFFRASAADFKKIPGSPIAYWVSKGVRAAFDKELKIGGVAELRQGIATGDNDRFLRLWGEVDYKEIGFNCNHKENLWALNYDYAPYNKGGSYRKWYGNNDYIIRFNKENYFTLKSMGNHCPSEQFYFKSGATWSALSSAKLSVRQFPKGFIFSDKGQALFVDDMHCKAIVVSFLNSNICDKLLKCISPTLDFHSGYIRTLPVVMVSEVSVLANKLTLLAKCDWDSSELSWDFMSLPLLKVGDKKSNLKNTYAQMRITWQGNTKEMQCLEEENNRIFIEAYGLQDELTPDVPLKEITLTCNPHYRYGGDKTAVELETLLLADTMKEFISYAVGCMFGRYSLDKDGLILANQGETLADYYEKVAGEEVVSDQWPVGSEEIATSHQPLATTGDDNERKELQGPNSLAEGNGLGGTGVSGNERVSEGGNLCTDQSGAAGGGIGSIQHCGGSGTHIDSGVQKLSIHSSRITGRSGDATTDCGSSELPDSRPINANHGNTSGSQQNDSSTDVQTSYSPLATNHFPPDDDNVIPILDGEWFTDDVTERFRRFVKVTFGEEHYQENLAFIEQSIGKDIRKYFLKDFYADHVKRYKKRPIYWMFSSPKGSFNALIYMHRYQPTTASVVLNGYLREFRTKLIARKEHLEQVSISASVSQRDKTQALKEIEKLKKIIDELESWERDVLYPLAAEQIDIDLDDGVKLNYPKFGKALKKVAGLS